MPFHKQGLYDAFDTIDEVRQHYRRCRIRKAFILSDDGVAADKTLKCQRCKGKLSEKPVDDPDISDSYHGNRCDYYPKEDRIVCVHYVCAWKGTLQTVADLPDRM